MKRPVTQPTWALNSALRRFAGRATLPRLALLGGSVLAAPALAQEVRQFNNAGVGDWATAANWTPAQLPTSNTNAYIDNGGTARVTAAGAQGRFVYLGSAAGKSGNLEISAPGELTALNMLVASGGSGALSIADGGLLTSAASAIGGPGGVTIQGARSKWTLTGVLVVSGPGGATLNVLDGGEYAGAFGGLQVGQGGTRGVVVVDGPTSKFASGGVFLGYTNGVGEFTVQNGAIASSFDVDIAQSGSGSGRSTGAATVTGSGSQWTLTSDVRVGVVGDGSLSIADGGVVTSNRASIGVTAGAVGNATISGAGSRWEIAGRLAVGGNAAFNTAGGTGALSIGPGAAAFVGDQATLYSGGTLALAGGELFTSTLAFQGGTFNWTSGALHAATVGGDLANAGGLLAPGQSAGATNVQGNYTQGAGAALGIELSGLAQGIDFDFVNVTGVASLDGRLNLSLLGGYVPPANATFAVLNAADAVSGEFANVAPGGRLATADGFGSFLVDYGAASPFDPNQVVLSSFQFAADVDGNGVVDGEDLAAWQAGFGLGEALPADGDFNGDAVVDGADLLVWQQQVNVEEAPLDINVAAAVPEPGTSMLAVIACAALGLGRRLVGRRRQTLACGLAAAALIAGRAEAQVPVTAWTNPVFGNWFIPTNWNPFFPTEAVFVRIQNGGIALVDAPGATAFHVQIGDSDPGETGSLVVSGAGVLTVKPSLSIWDGLVDVHSGGRLAAVTVPTGGLPLGGETDLCCGTARAVVRDAGSVFDTNRLEMKTFQGSSRFEVLQGGRAISTDVSLTTFDTGPVAATVSGGGSLWTSNYLRLDMGPVASARPSLQVLSGGAAETGPFYAQEGDVSVQGSGSRLSASAAYVGYAGRAQLSVSGAGQFTSSNAVVGYLSLIGDPASRGDVLVTGAGSRWSNSGRLAVGGDPDSPSTEANVGVVSVASGGVVASGFGVVGGQRGSAGTVTVVDPNSRWTSSSDIYIGQYGTGRLEIRNGGAVAGVSAQIGREAGSSGSVLATGVGSAWSNSGDILVGVSGPGNLEIRSGAAVSSFRGHLGFNSGSSGSVLVTDPGSTWTAGGSMFVGNGGFGSLQVLSGATASTAGNAYLGSGNFSQGTATVGGVNSQWSVANTLYVGGNGDGPAGPFASTLRIEGGGRVNAGSTTLYNTGVIELLDGSTLSSPLASYGGLLRTFGNVNYSGNATLGLGGLSVVNFTSGATTTFSGAISGVGGLTKASLGSAAALRLTGASTYAGPTTVNSGALFVDGSITSAATVNSGATFGGSGTVASVDVTSGGTLAPGTNGVGLLSTADVKFRAGSSLALDLRTDGAGSPGVDWDSLALSGLLDFSSLTPANPLNIRLRTVGAANEPSALLGWNPGIDHTWSNVITSAAVAGAFDNSLVHVDPLAFSSAVHGSFNLVPNGNNFDLFYDATNVDDGVLVTNLSEPLRGQTPIGNNPNPADPPEGPGAPWYWAAQSFRADDFSRRLVSIVARVGDGSLAPPPVVLAEIHADNNGVIGDLVATMTAPDVSAAPSDLAFTPDSAVTLEPDAAYWFVLGSTTPGDGTFFWQYIDTALAAGPGLVGNFADSTSSGGAWLYHGSAFPYYIQVNATIAPQPNADFDGNGVVDADDLAVWGVGFGQFDGVEDQAAPADGDANGDFLVDGADLLILQRQLDFPEADAGIAGVPEPATLPLLMAVLGGLPAVRPASQRRFLGQSQAA